MSAVGVPGLDAPPAARVRPPVQAAGRFAGLEGQRGIAAVLVVVFHAYQYDRSGPGAAYPYAGHPLEPLLLGFDGMVDWFFVLSAFLLTLPYARAVLAGRRGTSPGRFLGRRAVRIVPLYVVAVTIVWASRNPGLPGDWRDLVEHLTFTQVYDSKRIFYTIGPAWSLAVEVQFYVLLAVLGTVATRRAVGLSPAGRLRLLLAGTGVLAAASVAWSLVGALVLQVPLEQWPWWFGLPAKLVVLATGMAVAVLVARDPGPLPAPARAALLAAAAGVYAAASYGRQHTGGSDALFHGLCGLAFAAVVLAVVRSPARARSGGLRGRAARALEWAGLISYSLYLWHEPLLLQLASWGLVPQPSAGAFPLTAALLVALGLLVAWVSYWVVEHPASHLRARVDGPRHPAAPLPPVGAPEPVEPRAQVPPR